MVVFKENDLCQRHAQHKAGTSCSMVSGQHQVAKRGASHDGCDASPPGKGAAAVMNNKQHEPAHLMFIYQLSGRAYLTTVKSSLDMASPHGHTVDIDHSGGNCGSRTGTTLSGFRHS